PDFRCLVHACCDQALTVLAKSGPGDPTAVTKRLRQFDRFSRIPEVCGAIRTTAQHSFPIFAEGDGSYKAPVAKHRLALARFDVPQSRDVIGASGKDLLSVGAEGDAHEHHFMRKLSDRSTQIIDGPNSCITI